MPFVKFWDLKVNDNDPTVLDMYVYGQICSASSIFGSADDVVAGKFVEDLNKYPDTKCINVHINSPGGSVFAAAAIINQLRKHPACVHTWCEGICASAAVGILLAADKGCRHMSRATLLMIHNPSTKAEGDQATFLKAADLLAKVKKTILNIYTEGTGLSEEQLSAMMDAETYLDADEALANNFIDLITEEETTYDFHNEGSLICNGLSMDVAAELNVEKLRAKLERLSDADKPYSKILNEGGSLPMTFEDILSSLAEDQRTIVNEALATQVQAQVDECTNTLNATHEAAMQELRDQVAELTDKLSAQAQSPASPETAVINGMSPEARALLAQARADALAAQAELRQLQEAAAFAEFKDTFKVFDSLPIQDEHIKAMQVLAQTNADMYNELRELLRVANTAMSAGFTAQGTSQGSEVITNAWDAIEQKVADYRNGHADTSYNEALRVVLRENPELYDQYREGIYNH